MSTRTAGRPRALWPLLATLALLVFGFCAAAPDPAYAQASRQAIRVEQPPPDCNLAERRYDNPFSDHAGWTMRRYEWHAFYAVLSTAAAEGLHRVTHLPRWSTALIAAVGIGVVPHLRGGLLTRAYPIDPLDWAFDAFDRAAPVILWTGASGGTWQSNTLAATTELGGYFALACFASP